MESYPHYNKNLLEGKRVLITGGSRRGILMEIAKAYLLHGAKAVLLMSRNKEKNDAVVEELKQYAGKDCVCVSNPGDVRRQDECKRVVKYMVDEFGGVDILVNGAAGNFLASASRISMNGFKSLLEIETLGTMQMS